MELGAAEETPAKIAATETDSEYEDFFSNTTNFEISIWEGDPMDQHPPVFPPQIEQKAHSTANTSPNTHTPNITNKSTTVLCSSRQLSCVHIPLIQSGGTHTDRV